MRYLRSIPATPFLIRSSARLKEYASTRPLWIYPLSIALGALGFAVWVAWWATFGAPDVPAPGLDRADAPILLATAAVIASGAAILTGVAELREAMPPQKLRFTLVTRQDYREGIDEVAFTVRIENVGGHISSYWIRRVLYGGTLNWRQTVEDPGSSLVPGETRKLNEQSFKIKDFNSPDGGRLLIEWSTDRARRLKSTEIKLPAITPPSDLSSA